MKHFWNHRVVQKIDFFGETYFEIHEVYYIDSEDKIHAMTVHPITPYGNNVEELQETLLRMQKATLKPVLVESELVFFNYEDGDPDPDLY